MSKPRDFTVTVSNTFTATSSHDAVAQMAAWLDDNNYTAGYGVIDDTAGTSEFIDAEEIDYDALVEVALTSESSQP